MPCYFMALAVSSLHRSKDAVLLSSGSVKGVHMTQSAILCHDAILPTLVFIKLRWVCLYVHVYNHTYIHHTSYIHTYIRTYIHTYIRRYIRTYVHTYVHTYIHTYIRTYIHTYIHHTYVHVYVYTIMTMTWPLFGPIHQCDDTKIKWAVSLWSIRPFCSTRHFCSRRGHLRTSPIVSAVCTKLSAFCLFQPQVLHGHVCTYTCGLWPCRV